jgi:hypothetical protein
MRLTRRSRRTAMRLRRLRAGRDVAKRLRGRLAERLPISTGEPSELEEPEGHRDIGDGRGAGTAVAEGLVCGPQPLRERVALWTDADHIMKRRTKRPFADAGHQLASGKAAFSDQPLWRRCRNLPRECHIAVGSLQA